ncbi:hypothetical protein [Hyphomicrobium sp. DMF-1]|uniref:hypothetical protein n=1 Tax=Hyphomicrobium sp. DMF-1 TaxID=3019544 RepID=UPI0022EBAE66|nr:hypothetical protein [Hyphomicrobium sp. DMF-1]WBT39033.1 hypothetical protein PE058_03915 [Hyphomicrobium sp. DMF-1]
MGLLLSVAAFVSGHLSLARLVPSLAEWPGWIIEARTPLLFASAVAAVMSLCRSPFTGRDFKVLLIPALYGAFTLAYVFFPFPLVRTKVDILFGLTNFALFVWLYDPRYRNALAACFIGLSSVLIIAGLVLMGDGERLNFAGSPITLVRLAAVSMFLLLFMEGRAWLRLALVALHGFALVASVQLSAFVAIALAAAATPLIFISKTIMPRNIITNVMALALGCAVGSAMAYSDISGKLAFRLKQNEAAPVATQKPTSAPINRGAFPGGIIRSDVPYDDTLMPVTMPNFDKDTRVCIDDRSDRIKLFAAALSVSNQAPDKWGWGDQAFIMPLTRFGSVGIHKQPHNIFLDVLVTRGPFFLAGFIALLYVAAIQSMVAAYRSPTSAPFLIAAVYILLAAQWTGDFFDFRWFFLLIVPVIGAAYASPALSPSRKSLLDEI